MEEGRGKIEEGEDEGEGKRQNYGRAKAEARGEMSEVRSISESRTKNQQLRTSSAPCSPGRAGVDAAGGSAYIEVWHLY
jgi:hypothetical protein